MFALEDANISIQWYDPAFVPHSHGVIVLAELQHHFGLSLVRIGVSRSAGLWVAGADCMNTKIL